jgi:hypothetical protein
MTTNAQESEWQLAREMVQTQLQALNANAAWLAQRAGISRSIVSRFLAGRRLDVASALKIYQTVQPGMSATDKLALLQAMGLLELAMMLQNSVPVMRQPISEDPFELGCRLMIAASETTPLQALPLYQQAEQAFGPGSSVAVHAACMIVRCLLDLSEFTRAEVELTRIASVYDGKLELDMQERLIAFHGWLYFGCRDMAQAKLWFSRLQEAQAKLGIDIGESDHFLGMIDTRLGMQASSAAEADRLFSQAETHLSAATILHQQHRQGEITAAFDALRLSQLYAAQSRHDDARRERLRARTIFRIYSTTGTYMHCDVDTANELLLDGETAKAARIAYEALDAFTAAGYAQGAARSLRLLSLASMQEGHNSEALEAAVAGVCINPYATHGPQHWLRDLMTELNTAILWEAGHNQHAQLLAKIRERAMERRGVFAPLQRLPAYTDASFEKLLADLSGAPASP